MNIFLTLELLGLILSQAFERRPTHEQNPMLYRVLDAVGLKHIMEQGVNGHQLLLERLECALNILKDRFAYYQSQELTVCFALEQYLEETFNNLANGSKESPKTLAMMICAMGNKSLSLDKSNAVEAFIKEGENLIRQIMEASTNDTTKVDSNYHSFLVSNLMYIDKVLELVDVFSTTQRGMLAGVEEYAPVDQNFLVPADENLFVAGTCSGDTECRCGCQYDHPIRIIEGLEDLLNDRNTPNTHYVVGVCASRSDGFVMVAGNEGALFDSIKDMGKKALDALTEAFKAIMESFEPEEDEAKVKQVLDIAENNKKALQNIKNKGLAINNAAKQGVLKLAGETDESGGMATIVSKLNTVSDASGAIDALMGLLRKETKGASSVVADHKTADKALRELKAAASKSPSGDEKNKEVVDAEKAAMNKKIAEAKTAVKELKKGVTAHNKKFNGIKKAIQGITPHIFPNIEEKEEKKE